MAGAAASRTKLVEREFEKHAVEITRGIAAQFQPVYERICRERDTAIERAAVLQTAVELISLRQRRRRFWQRRTTANADELVAIACAALGQLGIVPDIQTVDGG